VIHLIIHPIIRLFKFIISFFPKQKEKVICEFCNIPIYKMQNGAYIGASKQNNKWICDSCYIKKYKYDMFFSLNEKSKAEKGDKQINFDETILDALRKRKDDLEEERQKIKTSPYLKQAIEMLLDFSTDNIMMEYKTFDFNPIIDAYVMDNNCFAFAFQTALIEEFSHILSQNNIKHKNNKLVLAIHIPSLKEYIERLSANEKTS
jgi:hypothetical protein